MLSSLALDNRALVKEGREMELMKEVDTVLFDKTGTLTREEEVGRVIGWRGSHRTDPGMPRPPRGSHKRSPWRSCKGAGIEPGAAKTDETQYKEVRDHREVEGHTVRVGSKRFMERGHRAAFREYSGLRRGAHEG